MKCLRLSMIFEECFYDCENYYMFYYLKYVLLHADQTNFEGNYARISQNNE